MREILERAIIEDDDIAAHSALADYLIEPNDPKGEFIRIQLALENPALSKLERDRFRQSEQELLDAHATDWLGTLAPFQVELMQYAMLRSDQPTTENNCLWTFERGYLRSLTIREFGIRHARAIHDCPESRFLRTLVLDSACEDYPDAFTPEDDIPDENQWGTMPGLYVLCRCSFPQLKSLRIGYEGANDSDYEINATRNATLHQGHYFQGGSPDNHCHVRPVAQFLHTMPKLEELRLFCDQYDADQLFATKSVPRLKLLQMYHLGNTAGLPSVDEHTSYHYKLKILAENPTFANLETLRFHPHFSEIWSETQGQESYLPLEQVRHLFRSPHLKKLRYLQLRLSSMGDPGVEELVKSGMLSQLKILDLRHGRISDDGAHLLANAPATQNLARLDLCRNALTHIGIEALHSRGINVRADAQQSEAELNANAYLFEGAFE
jgi:Leucine Rich repeat